MTMLPPRWCEDCGDVDPALPLPPRFGSCALKVRDFLLSAPSAGRSCSVCGEPLPRAAVHLTAHRDCEQAGELEAA